MKIDSEKYPAHAHVKSWPVFPLDARIVAEFTAVLAELEASKAELNKLNNNKEEL